MIGIYGLSKHFLMNILSSAVTQKEVVKDNKLQKILDSIEVAKGDYRQLDFFNNKNMGALLILSAEKNNDEAVEILLKKMNDHNLDINFKGNNNETALYVASCNGSSKVVERLINNGVDPNITNNDGDTPLIAAIRNGHYDIAQKIVDSKNANLDIQDKKGDCALALAIQSNQELAIKLIDKGVNLFFNSGENEQYHAIHCAAIYGADKVLNKIIDVDPKSTNYKFGNSDLTPPQ